MQDYDDIVTWEYDNQSQSYKSASNNIYPILGITWETIQHAPLMFYANILPEDRNKIPDFANIPQPFEKHIIIFRINHPTLGLRWIKNRIYSIKNVAQDIIGYKGLTYDITEEQKTIQGLDDEVTFFKRFADKLESVLWVMNPECTKQIYLSPAYTKLWGRDVQWQYNNPEKWISTIHPDDREKITANRRNEILTQYGPNARYEDYYRILKPDGSIIWIKDRSFAIYNDEGKCIGYAGIADDITKDREKAIALKAAKEKAEIANKTKADFLATISHELRTPLNAIIGISQTNLLKKIDDEQTNAMTLIHSASQSLLALINDILDFAKLDAGKLSLQLETFHLPSLLEEIIAGLNYTNQNKDVEIFLNYANFPYEYLIGDRLRIRQILTNLLYNAIKFTQSGHILLTVEEHNTSANNVSLQFSIEDTGIGISKETLETIFEQFTQADTSYNRQYQGVGLGLSIVKQLVELMHGKLGVHSQINSGSTFWVQIELPIDQKAKAQTKQQISEKKNIQILIIDNNKTSCEIIQNQLAAFNTTFFSETDFMKNVKLNCNFPHYDIILLSVKKNKNLENHALFSIIKKHPAFIASMTVLLAETQTYEKLNNEEKDHIDLWCQKPLQPYSFSQKLYKTWLTFSNNKIHILQPNIITDDKKVSVLLVEDNKMNQYVAKQFFNELGINPFILDNGTEALNSFNKKFDIIFLDISLPEISGIKLAQAIRSHQDSSIANTPLIALTAHVLPRDKENCYAAGFNEVLTKPLILSQLENILTKYLN